MGRGEQDEADRARDRGDAPDDGRDRVRRHGSSSARASATRRRCSTSARRSAADAAGRGRPRSTSRSTRSRARTSSPTARRARSRSSPRPRRAACVHAPGHVPREAVRRAGRGRARSTSAAARPRTSAGSPRRSAGGVGDITVVILERPRHDDAHRRGPRGRRPDQAHQRRRPVGRDQLRGLRAPASTRSWASAARPEGVITAAALRCLGGEIQARFRYRSDEERARGAADGPRRRGPRSTRPRTSRSGESLVFAATGVTAGDLLQGVRFFGGGARTHSLVDGLPDQAGPVRRHGPHVRPRSAAAGPPLGSRSSAR